MTEIKIAIATPIDGPWDQAKVAAGYAYSLARLLSERSGIIGMVNPVIMGHPSDLVRTRSRAVREARVNGCSHILWLDDDTIIKAGALGKMLASGHDFVGCPYPRKRIHWDRVARVAPGEDPERHAYDYAFQRTGKDGGVEPVKLDAHGCIEVDRMGFGCMLTSMRALDAMTERYRDELWFTDVIGDRHYDCVALFDLMMSHTLDYRGRPFRALYSEDYSICQRWLDMGGKVHMMVTAPADHVGGHLFKGATEGLIYAR